MFGSSFHSSIEMLTPRAENSLHAHQNGLPMEAKRLEIVLALGPADGTAALARSPLALNTDVARTTSQDCTDTAELVGSLLGSNRRIQKTGYHQHKATVVLQGPGPEKQVRHYSQKLKVETQLNGRVGDPSADPSQVLHVVLA